MLENIQITNKNGDAMMVEPICYLQVISTGKKYLLYTLNEKVDNDLTKIYVANVDDSGNAQSIEQSEWDNLRKAMSKMSKKEKVDDVEYLDMRGVNFVVGDAKKLGIPILLKQVFKDEAAARSIANVQESQSSGMFIDPSLVAEPVKENVVDTSAQSIFANPLKPTIDSNTAVEQSPVVNTIPNVQQLPANNATPVIEQPAIPVSTTQTIPNTLVAQTPPVVEEYAIPVTPNVIDNALSVENQISQNMASAPTSTEIPVVEQPVVVQPVEQSIPSAIQEKSAIVETVPVSPQNVAESKMITDDEALQAIDLLQKYIEQENKE